MRSSPSHAAAQRGSGTPKRSTTTTTARASAADAINSATDECGASPTPTTRPNAERSGGSASTPATAAPTASTSSTTRSRSVSRAEVSPGTASPDRRSVCQITRTIFAA